MVIQLKRDIDITNTPIAVLHAYLKEHGWLFKVKCRGDAVLMDAWRTVKP